MSVKRVPVTCECGADYLLCARVYDRKAEPQTMVMTLSCSTCWFELVERYEVVHLNTASHGYIGSFWGLVREDVKAA